MPDKFLAKYLRSRGYFVWKQIAKPKIGDEIEFIVGGNWLGLDSYTQTGIVTEFKDNDPKRPFKEYGYIRAVKKGADHIIYPKEVIRILAPNLLDKGEGA